MSSEECKQSFMMHCESNASHSPDKAHLIYFPRCKACSSECAISCHHVRVVYQTDKNLKLCSVKKCLNLSLNMQPPLLKCHPQFFYCWGIDFMFVTAENNSLESATFNRDECEKEELHLNVLTVGECILYLP